MRWYAKLSNGDIEPMTLDELDAAYEKGVIDGHTLVLAPEAKDWAELEKLASLDDAEATRPTEGSTDATEPTPASPRRRRAPKWVAPIAVGAVAAAAFAAAGFEAQRAGAFSSRRAPAQEASPPPPVIVATTDAPPPTAPLDLPRRPVPKEKERHSGRNPLRLAGTSEPSSGHAEAFTSGGNRFDPLNSDLP